MTTDAPGLEGGGRRRQALRRYPALVWLVAAGLLALLLPSGLTLPQSGPSTLAEYAPVPGAGEGSSDLGQLGAPESGTVGAGRGQDQQAAAEAPAPEERRSSGRLVRKAGTKRCVGDPPRQTEDPLSPPCIAFFEGDNGGATAKGVTRDEVVVTASFGRISSDRRAGEIVDCAEPVTDEDTAQDHLCKAYMKYFNDRYQTYDRTVHLYLGHNVDLSDLNEKYQPFAYVTGGSPPSAAQGLGLLGAGYNSGTREHLAKYAPHLMGFRPDLDDMADMAATMVCSKLAGRLARHAGDPELQRRERVFGYWKAASLDTLDRMIIAQLERRCDVKVEQVADDPRDQTVAVRFKQEGVTTVLLRGAELSASLTQQATRAQWFPEWVVPGSTGVLELNNNYSGRLADPLQFANAFGLTVDYRRDRIEEQPWYRAYREGCPQCPEPSLASGGGGAATAAATYDALTMLFYGIQVAGPKLTIDNVDRGMHAIPATSSDNPYRPAAYFGPGNYSFVKDATLLWWDTTGQAPGSAERGCWRLRDGGRRYRAGEWSTGDADLRAPGPCQGDIFR